MSDLLRKKNTSNSFAFPAISTASPEQYATGETVVDQAYSQTGTGAWSGLTLSDIFTEIATTGMYEITLLASECNFDQVLIKLTGAGMADDAILIRFSSKLIDDLNDFDPATDDVAKVLVVDDVITVQNIVNVTTITSTAEQICNVFDAVQPYRAGVPDIIANVLDSLSDPDSERYEIPRLVRLLDKAQKDLNIRAKILRAKVVFQLVPTQNTYTLPTDTRQITRAANMNGPIPLISHEEADDKFGAGWETRTGAELEALIYDKQNQKGFKTYPILDNPSGENALYSYVPSSDYGIIASIEDFTSVSDYGITVIDDNAELDSPYGVVATLTETYDGLRVTIYTNVNPETLTAAYDDNDGWVYSPLQVPETYDTILEHYMTGIALRDDLDTQNRDLGREHLALYADLVKQAISDSAKDSTSGSATSRNKPPKYNSAI